MLPDADSSTRWENGDRPALEKAFKEIGFETDIQNALNDTGKYATLADQQLTKGCSVMLLVDLNGAGAQVMDKAHAQGIPVIAYDRPIKGADYYVSFDNFHVGELEGQMIVDGLKKEGKDAKTAKVIYMGGDPTDGNAKQFHDGADSIMSAAGIKPAAEPPGIWDGAKAGVNFEQALTSHRRQGRRRLGRQRHQRRRGHPGPRQERPQGPGQRPGRLARRPAERPAGQAVRHGLQAVPARGRPPRSTWPRSWPNGEKPTADKKTDDGVPFLAMTPIVGHGRQHADRCSTTATPRSPRSAPARWPPPAPLLASSNNRRFSSQPM